MRRRAMTRHSVRLILLGNAGITLLEFVLSPVPGVLPNNASYLMALLISTPALIAPLWGLAHDNEELKEIAPETPLVLTPPTGNAPRSFQARFAMVRLGLRVAGLLFIAVVFLVGTISIFFELPTVQAADQGQQKLIHDLLRINVTHFYTDFWSCNRLAFLSKEQLICAVVDDHMQASNRGTPGYYAIVTSDPLSAYVFPVGFAQLTTLSKQAALNPGRYRRFAFDGYVALPPPKGRRASEHRPQCSLPPEGPASRAVVDPRTDSNNVGACRPDYSFSWF